MKTQLFIRVFALDSRVSLSSTHDGKRINNCPKIINVLIKSKACLVSFPFKNVLISVISARTFMSIATRAGNTNNKTLGYRPWDLNNKNVDHTKKNPFHIRTCGIFALYIKKRTLRLRDQPCNNSAYTHSNIKDFCPISIFYKNLDASRKISRPIHKQQVQEYVIL